MDILPEAEVKEDQIREMDKDLTTTADMNPDVKVWLSKIHALTEARHENHKKLTEINLLREECHAKCRILIEDNRANFQNNFPNASGALVAEFNKANLENLILDDFNLARKKQKNVYNASRTELAEMYKNFNNLFPDCIPPDNENRRIISFAATDVGNVLAFFRTCSPKDVAREIFTHKALPGFKICSCEKSFNRDNLPPSYRVYFELARQFPDVPGRLISYDTLAVTEKMRNPQRRKETDIFTTTLETVWVYDSVINRYEPHLRQQVFHKFSMDQVNGSRRRMKIYVEISVVDIE
ncbi:hypothetical protein BcDW1_9290 [Botrytis cinerea BcDW1]|uniref:Uncharacterized protein n=1 Tax=Botryotinia fuckeliana (strain BcDW1) TaxID=1290391 RepID=M7TLL7_BOTF1|nr:hypothetical protein BcDW1_9290 [Botrytis cinerea BcDW1]